MLFIYCNGVKFVTKNVILVHCKLLFISMGLDFFTDKRQVALIKTYKKPKVKKAELQDPLQVSLWVCGSGANLKALNKKRINVT